MTTETAASGGGASDLDLFEEEATGKTSTTNATHESSTVPQKYAGKTVEDLIKMHQNAERLVSRQGEELGQMRKYADALIDLKKPTTQVTEERKPVTVDALLNDPEKAINAAVANSPLAQRAAAAEQRAAQLEVRLAESEFTGKHGATVARDINDPAFLEWVNKNPLRQALAASSANQQDPNRFVAAKNIWDLWDEHQDILVAKQNTQQRQDKQRTVPTTVRQHPIDATQSRKPVWSRAKLMELRLQAAQGNQAAMARLNDPGFQERMHEAYAENRVR